MSTKRYSFAGSNRELQLHEVFAPNEDGIEVDTFWLQVTDEDDDGVLLYTQIEPDLYIQLRKALR